MHALPILTDPYSVCVTNTSFQSPQFPLPQAVEIPLKHHLQYGMKSSMKFLVDLYFRFVSEAFWNTSSFVCLLLAHFIIFPHQHPASQIRSLRLDTVCIMTLSSFDCQPSTAISSYWQIICGRWAFAVYWPIDGESAAKTFVHPFSFSNISSKLFSEYWCTPTQLVEAVGRLCALYKYVLPYLTF